MCNESLCTGLSLSQFFCLTILREWSLADPHGLPYTFSAFPEAHVDLSTNPESRVLPAQLSEYIPRFSLPNQLRYRHMASIFPWTVFLRPLSSLPDLKEYFLFGLSVPIPAPWTGLLRFGQD